MKSNKLNISLLSLGLGCMMLFGSALTFTACKENISEDAFAICYDILIVIRMF